MRQVKRLTRRRTIMPVAAFCLAVTSIGCGSDNSTAGDAVEESSTTTVAGADDTSGTQDAGADDPKTAEPAGTERIVALLIAQLPVLPADEAACIAGVIRESLGDYSEVITGADPDRPLNPAEIAQLTQRLTEGGDSTSAEENAAAVSECVQNPVSFSGSASPPTGEVANCVNNKLSGSAEYQIYVGEFRFLGTYYDPTTGKIVSRGAGVEVAEPTSALLVGACPG